VSASYIILSSWPFFCQKLLKLVEIWRSYDKNNFNCFFETRCIISWNLHLKWQTMKLRMALSLTAWLQWQIIEGTCPTPSAPQGTVNSSSSYKAWRHSDITDCVRSLQSRCVWSKIEISTGRPTNRTQWYDSGHCSRSIIRVQPTGSRRVVRVLQLST